MDQELIAKLHDLAKMAEEKGWPGIPVVGGWPMPPDGGVVRLFMALGLGDWVEIPERAILLRAPVPGGSSESFWLNPEVPMRSAFAHAGVALIRERTPARIVEILEGAEDDGGEAYATKQTRYPFCLA